MQFRRSFIAGALFALVGCADTGPDLPSPEADSCNVRQYADLISQDATALEKVLIMRQVRVIRPGTAVTLDYRPERVNFHIDADERIARIACG